MRNFASISDISLVTRGNAMVAKARVELSTAADYTKASDELLMEAYVAKGDERAHRALFERLAPAMLRVARRRLPSDDLAGDAVQQAFLNMHRFRFDFQQGKRVRPWLTTIVMNLVREHHRKQGRRKEQLLDEIQSARIPAQIEHPTESMERSQTVERAMDGLLESQREVIELHWFQDKSYEEISKAVGASVAAVRVRAHRGYERMRAVLALEAC